MAFSWYCSHKMCHYGKCIKNACFHKTSTFLSHTFHFLTPNYKGAQWPSGRVLDLRPRGRGFKPHPRHCVLVLEQDTFILA